MVESLVKRIAAAWREHFARTVAVKFNCFFLMPFVDEFPSALREKIDDLFADAKEPKKIGTAFTFFLISASRFVLRPRIRPPRP